MQTKDIRKRVVFVTEEKVETNIKSLINQVLEKEGNAIDVEWIDDDFLRIEFKDEHIASRCYEKIRDICEDEELDQKVVLEMVETIKLCKDEESLFDKFLKTELKAGVCESVLDFSFLYHLEAVVCLINIRKLEDDEYVISIRDTMFGEDSVEMVFNNITTVLKVLKE